MFASYTRKAQSPMRSFATELTKVAATMAKADRVAEVMAADDVLPEPAGAYRGPRALGDVALQDVSFGYGPDRPVLEGLTLHVARGERIAVMGPSGAGKSTLGALLARFFDPTGGRVLIDGRDARECSLSWLREQVAVLLQDTVLFSGTVHENIGYATDATREDVVAAARAAAAHGFIAGLPMGYDTDLGPQGDRALRRPAPADRDRPHAAARPAGAGARRAHHRARRRQRGRRARRPAGADARADDAAHHPLAAAGGDRRPHRGAGARPDRVRGGDPCLGR